MVKKVSIPVQYRFEKNEMMVKQRSAMLVLNNSFRNNEKARDVDVEVQNFEKFEKFRIEKMQQFLREFGISATVSLMPQVENIIFEVPNKLEPSSEPESAKVKFAPKAFVKNPRLNLTASVNSSLNSLISLDENLATTSRVGAPELSTYELIKSSGTAEIVTDLNNKPMQIVESTISNTSARELNFFANRIDENESFTEFADNIEKNKKGLALSSPFLNGRGGKRNRTSSEGVLLAASAGGPAAKKTKKRRYSSRIPVAAGAVNENFVFDKSPLFFSLPELQDIIPNNIIFNAEEIDIKNDEPVVGKSNDSK